MPIRRFCAVAFVSLIVGCASQAGTTTDADTGLPGRARADAAAPSALDPNVIQTPNETAGSRLRPYYLSVAGADGAKALSHVAWHDTQRDEACTYQKLPDGKLHCAPWGEEPLYPRESTFRDASCTQPIIVFGAEILSAGVDCTAAAPPTKRYVRTADPYSCTPARISAFPTARLTLPTFYERIDGRCQPVSGLSGYSYEVFDSPAPLEEVDPSAFVVVGQADETPVTADRLRVSRTHYTGADGSTSIKTNGIVDSQSNELCHDGVAADGEHRCLPFAAPFGTWASADAQCSRPAWGVSNSGGCITDERNGFNRHMAKTDETGCRMHVYPRFTTGGISQTYSLNANMCTAGIVSSAPGGYFYYDSPLPAEFPPSSFAPVGTMLRNTAPQVYATTGARLVPRFSSDGIDPVFADAFVQLFDTQDGDVCVPTTLEDGKTHCVGSDDYLDLNTKNLPAYADANCTKQVVATAKHEGLCAPAAGVRAAPGKYLLDAAYGAGGCQTYRLYRRPVVTIDVAQLFMRRDNQCVPRSFDVASYDFFPLDGLVTADPSELVELTDSIVEK